MFKRKASKPVSFPTTGLEKRLDQNGLLAIINAEAGDRKDRLCQFVWVRKWVRMTLLNLTKPLVF